MNAAFERRKPVLAPSQCGVQRSGIGIQKVGILLVNQGSDRVGRMRRIENQIEMTTPQPVGALPSGRLPDRVPQMPDAPRLNTNHRIQTTVPRQHLHRRRSAQTRDPRLQHARAERLDRR